VTTLLSPLLSLLLAVPPSLYTHAASDRSASHRVRDWPIGASLHPAARYPFSHLTPFREAIWRNVRLAVFFPTSTLPIIYLLTLQNARPIPLNRSMGRMTHVAVFTIERFWE